MEQMIRWFAKSSKDSAEQMELLSALLRATYHGSATPSSSHKQQASNTNSPSSSKRGDRPGEAGSASAAALRDFAAACVGEFLAACVRQHERAPKDKAKARSVSAVGGRQFTLKEAHVIHT